jgi:hypothetical protein
VCLSSLIMIMMRSLFGQLDVDADDEEADVDDKPVWPT